MKKGLLVFIFIFLGSISLFALDARSHLKSAQEAYQKGDFNNAVRLYLGIAQNGNDPSVFFNLGNSYYRSGDPGSAVLYYEKALKLNPLFRDASFNLKVVKKSLLDKEKAEENPFVIMWNSFVRILPSNILLLGIIICLLLVISCLFLLVNGKYPRILFLSRRFFGWIILMLVFFIALSGIKIGYLENVRESIVMTEEVALMSGPGENFALLFKLHKGAKVRILSSDGEWRNVRFGKEMEGWTRDNALEKI